MKKANVATAVIRPIKPRPGFCDVVVSPIKQKQTNCSLKNENKLFIRYRNHLNRTTLHPLVSYLYIKLGANNVGQHVVKVCVYQATFSQHFELLLFDYLI